MTPEACIYVWAWGKLWRKYLWGLEKWFWRYFSRGKYLEIYRWNIWAVFLERTWRGLLGKYLGGISGKNLRGGHWGNICRIFWGGFWREYRPLYFICWYQLANKHFEMKFEIHFEFRASLIKFQDLNFWDATNLPHLKGISSSRFGLEGLWV